METCDYCGETFTDADDYFDHLEAEHHDELGPIDQRRVADRSDPAPRISSGHIAFGLVGVVLVVGAIYAVAITGFGGNAGPTLDPGTDVHGTLNVTIDGEPLDLSGEHRFIENDQIFHFHGNEYERYGAHVWHIHGEGVTLQYALDTLGIAVTDDGSVLEFDGERYDNAEPETTVSIRVNGEAVAPGTYELEGVGPMNAAADGEGDDVVIVAERTQ